MDCGPDQLVVHTRVAAGSDRLISTLRNHRRRPDQRATAEHTAGGERRHRQTGLLRVAHVLAELVPAWSNEAPRTWRRQDEHGTRPAHARRVRRRRPDPAGGGAHPARPAGTGPRGPRRRPRVRAPRLHDHRTPPGNRRQRTGLSWCAHHFRNCRANPPVDRRGPPTPAHRAYRGVTPPHPTSTRRSSGPSPRPGQHYDDRGGTPRDHHLEHSVRCRHRPPNSRKCNPYDLLQPGACGRRSCRRARHEAGMPRMAAFVRRPARLRRTLVDRPCNQRIRSPGGLPR